MPISQTPVWRLFLFMLFEICATITAVRRVGAPVKGGGINGTTTGRAGGGKANSTPRGLGGGARRGVSRGVGRDRLGSLPLRGDGVMDRFPIPVIRPFAARVRERPYKGSHKPDQEEGEKPGEETGFA